MSEFWVKVVPHKVTKILMSTHKSFQKHSEGRSRSG